MKKYSVLGTMVVAGIIGFGGVAQADLNNGLVAYYPFNGNAHDESGNENDGTVNGATPTEDRLENINKSYLFNGDDNYIDIDNLYGFSSDFAVSFWFKSSLNEGDYLFQKGREGNSYDKWVGCWQDELTAGKVNCAIDDGSTAYVVGANGTDTWFDNGWHHIVFIRQGNILYTYKNSQLDDTQTAVNTSVENQSTLGIGRAEYSRDRYMSGSIDEFRIYNRALSESEIQQLFWGGGQTFSCQSDSATYDVWSTRLTIPNVNVGSDNYSVELEGPYNIINATPND